MKQAEVLGIIKRELRDGILSFDFKVGIGQRNAIVIERYERNEKLIMEFGVIIYDDFKVEDFFTLITILEIENVMTSLLRKNGLIGGSDDEIMLTSSLNKLDPELYKRTLNPTYPKKIETEQDVLDLLHDLKQYTENVAGPFFEKWSDLRVLDKFLDTVPQMDVHKYLGGYGGFSKLLVYKLCNNPKYDEYFNFIYSFNINRYKENPNGDIAIKQKHDFIIDFKEVLDRTEPIYNL
jgi:hypothetical protein